MVTMLVFIRNKRTFPPSAASLTHLGPYSRLWRLGLALGFEAFLQTCPSLLLHSTPFSPTLDLRPSTPTTDPWPQTTPHERGRVCMVTILVSIRNKRTFPPSAPYLTHLGPYSRL